MSRFALLGPISVHLISYLALHAAPVTAEYANYLELNYTAWRDTSTNASNMSGVTRDACNLTVWSRDSWNQSGVNEWLHKRLEEFRKDPPAEGDDFVKNFLQPAFTHGASNTLADCNVDHECEVCTTGTHTAGCILNITQVISSCEDLNHLEDRAEAAIAQQVMKSISNLNNAFFDVISAIDAVNIALGESMVSLVDEFTLAHEWDVYEDRMKKKKQQEIALIMTAATILAALAGLPQVSSGATKIFGDAALVATNFEKAAEPFEKAFATFSGSVFASSGTYNLVEGLAIYNDQTDTGV